MPEFEPVLLRRIHQPDSTSLHSYRNDGGYQTIEKALNDMSRDDVREMVTDAGLRGRGGAKRVFIS